MDPIISARALPSAQPGDGATLYVGFLAQPSTVELPCTDTDELHVHGRELYWLCRTRISDSKLTGASLEKILGMPITLRNHNTVRRLVDNLG